MFSVKFAKTISQRFFSTTRRLDVKNILIINSSAFSEEISQSKALTEFFRKEWVSIHPDTRIISRDTNSIPHFDAISATAFSGKTDMSHVEKERLQLSDDIISEIKLADMIVIGAPMYNFSIPSSLKALFDHIIRMGVTFKYTEKGPEGMLENKPVMVITTGGGYHQQTDHDYQGPLVKYLLSFIGITNVAFVKAQGLGLSADQKASGMLSARAEINTYISSQSTNAPVINKFTPGIFPAADNSADEVPSKKTAVAEI